MSDLIEYAQPAAGPLSGPGQQLQTLLIEGESLRAIALQHRLYALVHRRNVAAATSGRFIFMRRPLLGGYQPLDIRWQDLKEVRLDVGMFSATLTLTYSVGMPDTASGEGETSVLSASGLTTAEAQALYRACQAEEQAWREKRRVRAMEEKRAAGAARRVEAGAEDPAARLAKARKMLAEGLITDAEFEAIKARIVAAL